MLGFILGPMAEDNLRRGLMITAGDPTPFFTRPISAILFVMLIVSVIWSTGAGEMDRHAAGDAPDQQEGGQGRDMNDRKVRFGIIGAGVISAFHAEAIQARADAQLTAVYDVDAKRRASSPRNTASCLTTTSTRFLAAAPIDAVTVATPTGLHATVAIPAARAGKHVLCEKPLEVTPEKSQAIIDACRENDVILAPVFQYRFGAGAVT